MKLSVSTVVGVLFLTVSMVYLLLIGVSTKGHNQTIVEIALLQPYVYWQTIVGSVCGFYIGSRIGMLPVVWRQNKYDERIKIVIGLVLVFVVCLQMLMTGRSTIGPLLREQNGPMLLYMLPLNVSCVMVALLITGIVCLRRGSI